MKKSRSAATRKAVPKKSKSRRSVKKRQRPLHRALLIHPITFFLLLCVGVLLVCITLRAGADDIAVTAKISAPFLTDPAVIETVASGTSDSDLIQLATSPEQAVVVRQSNITLNGNCPKDSYLKAFRNKTFAGTMLCVGDPTFSVRINLVPGLNAIDIQDYNLTDDPGPVTPTVYVYYDNSQPPTNTITPIQTVGTPSQPPATPVFLLISNYVYKSVIVGKSVSWTVNFLGGSAPYSLYIDFGDHTTTTLTAKNNQITFSHIYKQPSGAYNSYVVKITVKDSGGNETFLQLMAIVKPKANNSTVAVSTDNIGFISSSTNYLKNWLWLAWPAYSIVVLMSISFWLGEREEVRLLRRKNTLRKRRQA